MKKKLSVLFVIIFCLAATFSACGKKVESVVAGAPDRLVYAVGDTLNLEGGSLLIKYSKGKEAVKPLDHKDVSVCPVTLSEAGEIIITVSYSGKSDSFTVTVTEDPVERVITGISLTPPSKTEYFVGDTIDLEGGMIEISYNIAPVSETITMNSAGVVVTPTAFTAAGTTAIAVNYAGFTQIFTVHISEQ